MILGGSVVGSVVVAGLQELHNLSVSCSIGQFFALEWRAFMQVFHECMQVTVGNSSQKAFGFENLHNIIVHYILRDHAA